MIDIVIIERFLIYEYACDYVDVFLNICPLDHRKLMFMIVIMIVMSLVRSKLNHVI